jgi:hypothetical protein
VVVWRGEIWDGDREGREFKRVGIVEQIDAAQLWDERVQSTKCECDWEVVLLRPTAIVFMIRNMTLSASIGCRYQLLAVRLWL